MLVAATSRRAPSSVLEVLYDRDSPDRGWRVGSTITWPAHSCKEPATSRISGLTTERTALPMILQHVSPIPIGRIPGHLSKAISLHATKPDRPIGST